MAIKNLDVPVTNLDGTTVKDGTPGGETKDFLTIKAAIVTALQTPLRGDETLSAAEVFKNMQLADRINSAEGDVKIESEEITMIKNRVAKGWSPIVLYRTAQLLEGKD